MVTSARVMTLVTKVVKEASSGRLDDLNPREVEGVGLFMAKSTVSTTQSTT